MINEHGMIHSDSHTSSQIYGSQHLKPTCFLKRRRLAVNAVILGICSGLVAVCFRLGLEKAEHLRETFLGFFTSAYFLLPSAVLATLITLTVLVVTYYAPESSGSGIPHLKGVLHEGFEFRDVRVLIVKFFGGIVAIGSGLALGREGPTVQMGASTGSILSRWFGSNEEERELMICSGAGAGLAAAFNAPLAGLLFIIEELHLRYDKFSLVAAFGATISGTLVCRLILGQAPIFSFKVLHYPALHLIFWCLVFGVVLGFCGLFFNTFLIKSLRRFSHHKIFLAVTLGLAFGFIGLHYPQLLGSGHNLIAEIMAGKFSLSLLFLLFFGRFFLTMLSYNTGVPGGIFAPLLLLGAIMGGIFFNLVEYVHPGEFRLEIFLVLGMGGLFTAIVRSPLTGIVLILEMTNEFFLLLPLMLVAIVAYGIPEYFANRPIYDGLLLYSLEKKRYYKTPVDPTRTNV
ncbi:MAG: H(+)/Cl(-) exchange transporter ClcA [Candidatus Rifleibacteriota bacterium]